MGFDHGGGSQRQDRLGNNFLAFHDDLLTRSASPADRDAPRTLVLGSRYAMNEGDMVQIPAGRFRMGSAGFYPEERPVREVEVGAFTIDRGPVTVSQFAQFVEETGYSTVAERPVDAPCARSGPRSRSSL